MTLLDHITPTLIQSFISTGVVSAIAYLLRDYIKDKLLCNIKFTYDAQLEALKADLKAKEQSLSALSNGALSGVSFRKNELYKLQSMAVQKLWDEVIGLTKAKGIASIMQVINFDEFSKLAESNEKARQLIKELGSGFDMKEYDFAAIEKIRPFVSPMAWALFAAYKEIIVRELIKQKTLEFGVAKNILEDSKKLVNVVTTALPDYSDYIEANKDISLFNLLKILEERLLDELKKTLDGKDDDIEQITRAANILKAVENFAQNDDTEKEKILSLK